MNCYWLYLSKEGIPLGLPVFLQTLYSLLLQFPSQYENLFLRFLTNNIKNYNDIIIF